MSEAASAAAQAPAAQQVAPTVPQETRLAPPPVQPWPQVNPPQVPATPLPQVPAIPLLQAAQTKKRPSWLKIIGVIVFLLFVAGAVFGLWWYLGHRTSQAAS